MIYSDSVDIVFKPSATLSSDSVNHKISNWHDIPGLFVDGKYDLVGLTEGGDKFNIKDLTETRVTIYEVTDLTPSSINSYTRYYIKKSPNSNAVQFKYDIYDKNGVEDLTTFTLKVWRELKDFYEKLFKYIRAKHPNISIPEEKFEKVVLELLSDAIIDDIKRIEDKIK